MSDQPEPDTREEQLRAQLDGRADDPGVGVQAALAPLVPHRRRRCRRRLPRMAVDPGQPGRRRHPPAAAQHPRVQRDACGATCPRAGRRPSSRSPKATPIQVNGRIGIRNEIELADWTVRVEGPDGELLDELDISAFEALPQRDMVIEHKCIEGWSSIVHWGGTRFSDFHARYADQVGDVPYVGFETPDGLYYVGWDMASAMHPQTMLALRQGTEPLTQVTVRRCGSPRRTSTASSASSGSA